MFNLPTIEAAHSTIRVDGSLYWNVLWFEPEGAVIETVEDLPPGQFLPPEHVHVPSFWSKCDECGQSGVYAASAS